MSGNGHSEILNDNGYAVTKKSNQNGSEVNKVERSTVEASWYTFESVQETANYLLERTKFRPKIGLICGSGLGAVGDNLEEQDSFSYEQIPNFPVSTVAGHNGRMIFGLLKGIPVMCMQGRFHYYEGYPLTRCSMPIRVMKLLGITHLIATNAAGGLNPNYKSGDIMIIKDHINIMGFAGNNPLQGHNDPRFGLRFPSMNKAYDPKLIQIAKKIARDMGKEHEVHDGVYVCLGGPNYETVAELKLLQLLGVDAVGMSTVHEVITAKHSDMTVFAFSLITNKCVVEYETDEAASHDEVIETGALRQEFIIEFLNRIVKAIVNLEK